jgi:AbrB family looped-hinge helix DNA binding protein
MSATKVKMNSRGTITIPSEIRKGLELESDSYFHIYIDDGAILLVPIYDLTKNNPFNLIQTYPKENFDDEHNQDLESEKRL